MTAKGLYRFKRQRSTFTRTLKKEIPVNGFYNNLIHLEDFYDLPPGNYVVHVRLRTINQDNFNWQAQKQLSQPEQDVPTRSTPMSEACSKADLCRLSSLPRVSTTETSSGLAPSLFEARFTAQEGAGRLLSKGTGAPLSDPSTPLLFPRNNNRLSGPDSNSCAGCPNQPISGGAGDLSTNVFVLGQRFDFVTFDSADGIPTRGAVDERGVAATLQSIANSRSTVDMFGSGYYEMLARQITADLQLIRDNLRPGQRAQLISKGISFGLLGRNPDGTWITSAVEGLPPQSLVSADAQHPPSLLILPFHQAASTVSLRVFTNDAFNQHHGMQSTERFGIGTDPDGDGIVNELTRADITAVTLFQATLPVPGRVLPREPSFRKAARDGEQLFQQIGCASCHIPSLPLDKRGWIFTEPGPYNPAENLQSGQAPTISVDLSSGDLPQPRLQPANGVVMLPLYTDFKLHDICKRPTDPNVEPLNANEPAGSAPFFAGNSKFLTRRLWAVGSKPNYFHHGQFTTIREAILNHFGEALASQQAFSSLSSYRQGSLIEFLKTLQLVRPAQP